MLHVALVLASTRPTWPDILVFASAAASGSGDGDTEGSD